MQQTYSLADLQNWRSRAPDGAPIRLGVFGSPVAHSRSPEMHNAALQHCGLEMRYARFEIAPAELEAALRLLPSLGYVGVNLTIPHKIAAVSLVDSVDEFARRVGAINSVRVVGEKLVGFNTDGPGFARAIRSEFSVDLRDLRVLVFGAGGAARAIAVQCALERCGSLILVNRTVEKALKLASDLRPTLSGPDATRLEVSSWNERAIDSLLGGAELAVNATALGMRESDPPVLPPQLVRADLMIYDTIYGVAQTPLVAAAQAAGARSADGRSMLVHQGALAFEAWFGGAAPLTQMRAVLEP